MSGKGEKTLKFHLSAELVLMSLLLFFKDGCVCRDSLISYARSCWDLFHSRHMNRRRGESLEEQPNCPKKLSPKKITREQFSLITVIVLL